MKMSMVYIIFRYHVYIDENGDAAGNYTVLKRGLTHNYKNKTVLGLVPVGTFSQYRTYGDKLPVNIENFSIKIQQLLIDYFYFQIIIILRPFDPAMSRVGS